MNGKDRDAEEVVRLSIGKGDSIFDKMTSRTITNLMPPESPARIITNSANVGGLRVAMNNSLVQIK